MLLKSSQKPYLVTEYYINLIKRKCSYLDTELFKIILNISLVIIFFFAKSSNKSGLFVKKNSYIIVKSNANITAADVVLNVLYVFIYRSI